MCSLCPKMVCHLLVGTIKVKVPKYIIGVKLLNLLLMMKNGCGFIIKAFLAFFWVEPSSSRWHSS